MDVMTERPTFNAWSALVPKPSAQIIFMSLLLETGAHMGVQQAFGGPTLPSMRKPVTKSC